MSGMIAATGFADSAFAQNFYKSFIANGRWELYVSGLGRTLEVTVLALLLGVVLGVITALLRVAHDQRRPGQHSAGSVLLKDLQRHHPDLYHRDPRHPRHCAADDPRLRRL